MVKQEKRAMETDSAKTGAKSSFEFYEALKKKEKDEQILIIEKKALPKTQSDVPPQSPLTSQKRVSTSKSNQTEKKILPGVQPPPSGLV